MTKKSQRSSSQLNLDASTTALTLCREIEIIDLHIDTFIPHRLWGYNPLISHNGGPFGRHFFGHLDLPRMTAGGLNAAMWSITTNPFRKAKARWTTFEKNLNRLKEIVNKSDGQLQFVRNPLEYRDAIDNCRHAVLLSIQGGNAFEAAPDGALSLPNLMTRVTLIHLTNARFGATSSPDHLWRSQKGLSKTGFECVEQLNHKRIFVDLAHIHPRGFWDALAIHRNDIPPIVTHTGVSGVRKHWRNLDDSQIKAIAERGGVIGVIFAANFLRRRDMPNNAEMVIEHIEHIIKIAGEDVPAIGSDLDGAISPPPDLANGSAYARIVDVMLQKGWSEDRIKKICGDNFLRSWKCLRP